MDDKIDLNKYQEISRTKGLPPICPIRDFCQRRAKTLFHFTYAHTKNNNYAKLEGKLIDTTKKINEAGTPFEHYSNNRDLRYFYNACPEVNLFDDGYSLVRNYAISSGTWDKGCPDFHTLTYKHFSTCTEYNQFTYMQTSPEKMPDMIHFDDALKLKIEKLMVHKEYNSAIRESFVYLTTTIRNKFQINSQIDGTELINEVFGKKGEYVALDDKKKQAYRDLLSGFYGVYRNKYAHHDIQADFHEIKAIIEMINTLAFEIRAMQT
ncbi:TIGR02391 family protein [Thiothrix subterranea]|uniref:TIGR02391 family protein n=1 Tax=Thiothrix subterranea TaxID=2735563 RepID=UPI00280AA26D|nr:TIGR02391 family protein [Thiothrix subterranea]